jgi:hypothetical protein
LREENGYYVFPVTTGTVVSGGCAECWPCSATYVRLDDAWMDGPAKRRWECYGLRHSHFEGAAPVPLQYPQLKLTSHSAVFPKESNEGHSGLMKDLGQDTGSCFHNHRPV